MLRLMGVMVMGCAGCVWRREWRVTCESKRKVRDTAFWHLQALFCERTIGSPLVLDRRFLVRRHLLLSFVLIPFGWYLSLFLGTTNFWGWSLLAPRTFFKNS
jgi:hypothetical protein